MAPFTPELMALEPETFAERYLSAIGATAIAAGPNFRFGAKRRGDLELLGELGFEILEVVAGPGRVVLGDPRRAARGRRRRGGSAARAAVRARRHRRRRRPARRHARLPDREPRARAAPRRAPRTGSTPARRSGTAPRSRSGRTRTTAALERRIEPFLLDFDGDLYGKRLVVEVWERLRDEAVFASEEELVAQIGRDVEATRAATRPGSACLSRRSATRRRGRPTPAPRRSDPPRAPRDSRRRSAPRRRRRRPGRTPARSSVSYVSQVTYPRCGVASTASLATSGSAVAGSSSNTSTAALPGRPGGERSGERALLDQPGAGRVDEERVRLHQREVAGGDEPARLRRQLEVDADDVRALAERVEIRLGFVPVGGGALERRRASPGEHVHPERPSVAGDERADVPVADDPERASVQLPADRRLPRAGAKRDGVGDDAAGRGEDQRERQLGRGVRQTPSRCRRRSRAACTPSRSMWGIPRPVWQISLRSGRSASNGASIGVRSRIRTSASASPIWAARSATVSGRVGLHDDVVALRASAKRVEPLDGPLVVLHHDDAHPASLSRRRSRQARAPQRPRSRMAATIPPDPLSAGRVFLHAALRLRRHRRKEAPWPSPRKSSRS